MTSRDGKMSGNVQTVGRYNDAKDGGRGAERRPDSGGGHSGGLKNSDGNDSDKSVDQVNAEHGPAESHNIVKHGTEYESVTKHADGHEHKAKHGSLEEAHEHGKQAMEDTEHSEDDQEDAGIADQHGREERSGSGSGRRKSEPLGFME